MLFTTEQWIILIAIPISLFFVSWIFTFAQNAIFKFTAARTEKRYAELRRVLAEVDEVDADG